LPRLAWLVLGWLGPALCVVVAGWQVRKLSRLAAPTRAVLGERIRGLASPAERAELRQELQEQRRDAERGIALARLWPHSLARVSLASGTALGIASLAHRGAPLLETLVPAMGAFIGGFAGMAACAMFGRQAKGAAGSLRRGWREAVEMASDE
jgi:hypothetical protein